MNKKKVIINRNWTLLSILLNQPCIIQLELASLFSTFCL
jgi:hypothetical protein